MQIKKLVSLSFVFLTSLSCVLAQDIRNNPTSNHGNKFEQLGTILATPNEYRTASGAPGPKYWQQRADYDIKAILDEKKLIESWEEVMGKMIAKHTKDIVIRNKQLIVTLDSAALRNELSLAKTKIVKILNEKAGKVVITEVILR